MCWLWYISFEAISCKYGFLKELKIDFKSEICMKVCRVPVVLKSLGRRRGVGILTVQQQVTLDKSVSDFSSLQIGILNLTGIIPAFVYWEKSL